MRKLYFSTKPFIVSGLVIFFTLIRICNPNVIIADFKFAYNKFRIANPEQLKYYLNRISIPILSIVLLTLASSCSVVGYKALSNTDAINIAAISIFDDNFEKALYKTDIKIYGNNLTGITIIKNVDSSIRVVSMSELGMKYFDFEFPDNEKEPIVHYIMEPLNKKVLINLFKRDFNFLFYLPLISNSEVLINKDDKSNILFKHNKVLYFLDSNGNVTDIKKYRVILKSKSIVSISGYHQSYPDTINMNHGNISLNFVKLKK